MVNEVERRKTEEALLSSLRILGNIKRGNLRDDGQRAIAESRLSQCKKALGHA